jgi:hypothetical protein
MLPRAIAQIIRGNPDQRGPTSLVEKLAAAALLLSALLVYRWGPFSILIVESGLR